MYKKWQRATHCSSQTDKELRVYLQSIRTNLQELGKDNLLSKKFLIHHICQGLRCEVWAALYLNPTVAKNWLFFLAAVARAKSSIQKHESFFHPDKPPNNSKEKPFIKVTENNHNSNSQSKNRYTNGRRTFKPNFKFIEDMEATVVVVTIEEAKSLMLPQQVGSTIYTTLTQIKIVKVSVSTATS